MNKAILMWNVTKDLELKSTTGWTEVLSFSIATNWKIKKWDGWEDTVEFHNLVAWGNTAKTIAQYCKKGSKLLVEWEIKTRNWEDKETKKTMYRTEIIVFRFEFAWWKSDSNSQWYAPKPEVKAEIEEEISIDDIPF